MVKVLKNMAGPKFTYFHARGRSTPIRLAFAIGGLDYEDDRVDFPAFMARKQAGDFPFGSVPALTVDGVTLAQVPRTLLTFIDLRRISDI